MKYCEKTSNEMICVILGRIWACLNGVMLWSVGNGVTVFVEIWREMDAVECGTVTKKRGAPLSAESALVLVGRRQIPRWVKE